MKKNFARIVLLLVIAFFAGCQSGVHQMGATEFGIRFRRLPLLLGGGLSHNIVQRGETVVVWPWDTIYIFDSRIKDLDWGSLHEGGDEGREEYVQTRALDGNEVALAVKVQYSITPDPETLRRMIRQVATSEEAIAKIVASVARADIRTHMNKLRTSQFFVNEEKYRGEQEVKDSMSERLKDYGIIIHSVNLKEHRFERELADGKTDARYQEKINEVQTVDEQTKREKLRKETVRADKEREYNDAQADVNRVVAEADGFKQQSKLQGDAYFESKKNEAEAILAKGKAEVTGIIEQINALSGPGGRAILKLELAKRLSSNNSKFVLLDSGTGQGSLDVRRLDTNELLGQLGLMEGLAPRAAEAAKGGTTPKTQQYQTPHVPRE